MGVDVVVEKDINRPTNNIVVSVLGASSNNTGTAAFPTTHPPLPWTKVGEVDVRMGLWEDEEEKSG